MRRVIMEPACGLRLPLWANPDPSQFQTGPKYGSYVVTAENRGFGLKVQIKTATRLGLLPPYLFAELDRLKKEVAARALTLSVWESGTPTSAHHNILWRASNARLISEKSSLSRLRRPRGIPPRRCAMVRAPLRASLRPRARGLRAHRLEGRYRELRNRSRRSRRYRADSGSRLSGLLLGMRFQRRRTLFPAAQEGKWVRPDFASIPDEVARRARLLWLNYPNNPTAATVDSAFFDSAVRFCLKARTSFLRTIVRILKSHTTATARRLSSTRKIPANARSSSIRCRKLSR